MPDDPNATVDPTTTTTPVAEPKKEDQAPEKTKPELHQKDAKALHPALSKLLGNLVYGQLTQPMGAEQLAAKVYDIDRKYIDPLLAYLLKVDAKAHHDAVKRDSDQWQKDKVGVEAVYRAFDKVLEMGTGSSNREAIIEQFKKDFLMAVDSGANGGPISEKGKRKLMGDGNFLNQIAYLCGPKVYLELVPKLKFNPRTAKAIPGVQDPFALNKKDLSKYTPVVAAARSIMDRLFEQMKKIMAQKGTPSVFMSEEREDLDVLISKLNAFPHPWLVAATYNARPDFGGMANKKDYFNKHLRLSKMVVGGSVRKAVDTDMPADTDPQTHMALMKINQGLGLDAEVNKARELAKQLRGAITTIKGRRLNSFTVDIVAGGLKSSVRAYNAFPRRSMVDQVYGQTYKSFLADDLKAVRTKVAAAGGYVPTAAEAAKGELSLEQQQKVQQLTTMKVKKEEDEAAAKAERKKAFVAKYRTRARNNLWRALDELEDTCIDEGVVRANLRSPWGSAKDPKGIEKNEFWVWLVNDLADNDSGVRSRFPGLKKYGSLASYIEAREGKGSEDAMVEADLARYGHISLRTIAFTSKGFWNDDEDRVFREIESRSNAERQQLLDDSAAMKCLKGYLSKAEYRRVYNALRGKLKLSDIVATRSHWYNTEEAELNDDLKRYIRNADDLTANLEAGYAANLLSNKEQMAVLFDALDEDETLAPIQTLSSMNKTGARGDGVDQLNQAIYGEGQGFWSTFGVNDPSYPQMLAAVKKMDDVERLSLSSDPRFRSWLKRLTEDKGGGNPFERAFKAGELMAYLDTPKGDAPEAKLPIHKELVLASGFNDSGRAKKALLGLNDKELAALAAAAGQTGTVENMAPKTPMECLTRLRITDYWDGLVTAGYPKRAIFRIDHAGDAGEANKEHYILKQLVEIQDLDVSVKKKVLDHLKKEDWLDNFPTELQTKIETVLGGVVRKPQENDPLAKPGQPDKKPETEAEMKAAAAKKKELDGKQDAYVAQEQAVAGERLNSADLLLTASKGAGTDDPAVTDVVESVKGKDLLYNFSNIGEWISKPPGSGGVSAKVNAMADVKAKTQKAKSLATKVRSLKKLLGATPTLDPKLKAEGEQQVTTAEKELETLTAELTDRKAETMSLFGFVLDTKSDIYQSKLAKKQLAESDQTLRDEIGGEALQQAVKQLRDKLKAPDRDPELYAELRKIGFLQFMDPAYKSQMEAAYEIDALLAQRDITIDTSQHKDGEEFNLAAMITEGDDVWYDGSTGEDYAQSGYELMHKYGISVTSDGMVTADEQVDLDAATAQTADLRQQYQTEKARVGGLLKTIVQAVITALGTIAAVAAGFVSGGTLTAILLPAVIEAGAAAAATLFGGLAEHAIRGVDVAFEDYASEAAIEFVTTFAISVATAGLEKLLMPALVAKTATFKVMTAELAEATAKEMAVKGAEEIQKHIAYRVIKGGLSNMATGYMKGVMLNAADMGPKPGNDIWVQGLQGAFGGLMDGLTESIGFMNKRTFWSSAAKNFMNKGTTGLFDLISNNMAQDTQITEEAVRDALINSLAASIGATLGDMTQWKLERMQEGKTPAEVEEEEKAAEEEAEGDGTKEEGEEGQQPDGAVKDGNKTSADDAAVAGDDAQPKKEPDPAVSALMHMSFEEFAKRFRDPKGNREGKGIGKITWAKLQAAFADGSLLTLADVQAIVKHKGRTAAFGKCAETMQATLDEVAGVVAQYEAALKMEDYDSFVIPGTDKKASGVDDFAKKMKEIYGIEVSPEQQVRLVKAAVANSGISDLNDQVDMNKSLDVTDPDPFSRKPGEVYDDDMSGAKAKDLLALRETRGAVKGAESEDGVKGAIGTMTNDTDRQVLAQAWGDLMKLVPASDASSSDGSLTFEERRLIFDQTVAYLHDYRSALAKPGSKLPKPTPEALFSLLVSNQRKLAHQTVVDKRYVTSSDHGVKHVLQGNMANAEKMMDSLNMPPELRILVRQATIDHDMGYTMSANQTGKGMVGRTSDHPLLSTALIDQNWDKYVAMFGEDNAKVIRQAVLDHSNVKSAQGGGGSTSQVGAVVSMADCLGATHDTKLATIMSDPDVMSAMSKIHYLREKAKSSGQPEPDAEVQKIVQALKTTIEHSDHPPELKKRFHDAMTLLTQGDNNQLHSYYTKSNLSKIVGAQVDPSSVKIDDDGRVHATFQLDPNAAILQKMMTQAGAGKDDARGLAISGFKKVIDDFNKANGDKAPVEISQKQLTDLANGKEVSITTAHGVFRFVPPSKAAQTQMMSDMGASLKRDLNTARLSERIDEIQTTPGPLPGKLTASLMQQLTALEDSYQPNLKFTDSSGAEKDAKVEIGKIKAALDTQRKTGALMADDLEPLQKLVDQIYLTGYRKDS